MSEVRDELTFTSLKVEGAVTFTELAAQPGGSLGMGSGRPEVQADAALLLKLPGRCRLEASSIEGGHSVAVWSHGKKRSEGTPLPGLMAAVEQICPLLAVRSSSEAEARASIDRYVRTLKADLRSTSLARLGHSIAYVLGNPGDGQPQLWVYKDIFLPARVRWSEADGRWDLRFLDYGSPVTGEWFPRVIELYRKDELVLRFAGFKADPKTPISDKLF
jgi:hypothetical protein